MEQAIINYLTAKAAYEPIGNMVLTREQRRSPEYRNLSNNFLTARRELLNSIYEDLDRIAEKLNERKVGSEFKAAVVPYTIQEKLIAMYIS